jgi:hypothetical protein
MVIASRACAFERTASPIFLTSFRWGQLFVVIGQLSFLIVHRPLQASLCELRLDKSLEAQSAQRIHFFSMPVRGRHRKNCNRFAIIQQLHTYFTLVNLLHALMKPVCQNSNRPD